MAAALKPESLAELLNFVLWTESEFVEVLCGVARGSLLKIRNGAGDADLHDRRYAAERHVQDAILRGELRVEPRIFDRKILDAIELHVKDAAALREIRRAVDAARMYEPRKIKPEFAVAWAVERRALFPHSPLNVEHLRIAVGAGARSNVAHDDRLQKRLQARGRWLEEVLDKRGISIAGLEGLEGPDHKTTRKILDGKPVSLNVLKRLANALRIEVKEIP